MGRHSASDDEPDDAAVTLETPTLDLAPRTRGRHSSRDDEEPDDQPTQMIAVVDPALLDAGQPHDAAVTGEFAPVPGLPSVAEQAAAAEKALADKVAEDERAEAERAAALQAAAQLADKARQRAEADERRKAQKAEADERKKLERAEADERKRVQKAEADERKATPKAGKAQRKAARAARGETDTQADLRLLRSNTAVRAQVIAAVVVSFALYTLVMLVIGRMGNYALFVWAPIVVSGVLIGVVLDLAHRRATRPAAAEQGDDPGDGPRITFGDPIESQQSQAAPSDRSDA